MRMFFGLAGAAALLAVLLVYAAQSGPGPATATPSTAGTSVPQPTAAAATVVAVSPLAGDGGKPVSSAVGWKVPSSAQMIEEHAGYVVWFVPAARAADVLAFYQSSLPVNGWKIDLKYSDFTGLKDPEHSGQRSIIICRPSTARVGQGLWGTVLLRDKGQGTDLQLVTSMPDTERCP